MKTLEEIKATYDENFRRAQAMAFASIYLDDILNCGCQRLRESLLNNGPKVLSSLASHVTNVEPNAFVNGVLENAIVGAGSVESDQIKLIISDLVGAFSQISKDHQASVENIQRLQNGLLNEQTLVASVSAFDVMCKETAVNKLVLGGRVREITLKVDESDVEELQSLLGCSRAEASFTIYVEKRMRNGQWRELLSLALGNPGFLSGDESAKTMKNTRELRNIIVHNQRRADLIYKRKTGFEGNVGDLVKLDVNDVLEQIHFVDRFSTTVMRAAGIRVE